MILKYPNYATLSMKGKMLDNPALVRPILSHFHERILRAGLLETLTKAKRDDSQVEDKTLYLWDMQYYKQKWLEASYSVDYDSVMEYFPLQSTIHRMLSIFEELFGIVCEKTNGDVWHEDVEIFAVWDNEELGSGFLGYLYLDLFARPGKHPGGKYLSLLT